MNFSDRITFVQESEAHYDPTLGKWIDGKVVPDVQPCHLSSLGIERTTQLFGQIDKHVTVARLQRPYLKEYSYVLVGNERMEVLRRSDHRKSVLYLEGMASGQGSP